MKVLFHPASLLTIGDSLAFIKELSGQGRGPASARRSRMRAAELPPVEEQMGITIPVTARVPQRYLIQNQTGMMLWYWRPAPDGSSRGQEAMLLPPNGRSEELKARGTPITACVVAGCLGADRRLSDIPSCCPHVQTMPGFCAATVM